MNTIIHSANAGFDKKNDILITLEPVDDDGIQVLLSSPVKGQFGKAITSTIKEVLKRHNITGVKAVAQDNGAFDFTIRARTLTALGRALAPERKK